MGAMVLLLVSMWAGQAGEAEVRVRFETEAGPIVVAVDARRAPVTAANFLRYVDAGHYEGGRFHRVVRRRPDNQPENRVKIEVIQAGVASRNEAGSYPPIPLEPTSRTGLRHRDGTISMARLGPDTATSDFFICVGDQPELDEGGDRNPDRRGFAAFGRVVEGMEVVRQIHRAPAAGQSLTPPIRIQRALRQPTIDPAWEELARRVLIHRDSYGVPHVFGRTDAATIFGHMVAQCEDNFWQLEQDLLRGIGRAAEAIGERGVANDQLYLAFDVERLSREEYARLPASLRALCDAYAAGINYFMSKNPPRPEAADSTTRLLRRVEPWHLLALNRMGRIGGLSGLTRVGLSLAELRIGEPVGAVTSHSSPGREIATAALDEAPVDLDEGSNMWAIAPSKSVTGRPMMLLNPHVGFFGGGQRYEVHLRSDEGMDVYGFAILGTPYVRSGFTSSFGWCHTNNYADTIDGYLETFDDPADPLAYRYGSGSRRADEWEAEIAVRLDSGIERRRYRFRRTHHGPIVGARGGRPVAARLARHEEGGELAQRIAMARARNFVDFKRALARTALTGSNTIYADRSGRIYYLHGNGMPRRSRQFDWNLPVEGRLPEAEWQGYHPLEELPQLLNPAAGFLQNCNSTPFLMTDRGNPRREDYPGYMAPEEDTPRARRSRQILTGQPRFTFEEWTRFATDTAVIEAEAGIAQLVEEWERLKREDEARAEDLKPVLLELKAWDRVARLDSAATTLFLRWFEAGRASRPESSGPPGATQTDATLAGAPFPALRRLEQVVVELERDFDDWRVAWGEVNRLQRIFTSGEAPFRDDRPSLPVAGGPGSAGLIFTYNTRAEPGQRRRYGVSGNSWVAVVEFGARVRARSVLVFGQSADPASPHHLDQAQLYADGQFKPVLFHSEEVRAGARRSYRP